MNGKWLILHKHSSSSTKHFKNQNRLQGCKIRDRTYHIDDEDILIDGKVWDGIYLPIMRTKREIGCMLLNKKKSSSRKILKNMGTGGFT